MHRPLDALYRAGLRRGSGFAAAFLAAIPVIMPPPALAVSDWAQAKRVVSPESGSPHPGSWSNALVPEAVEIMDCLSFHHPCRDVVFKKSHQVVGTEVGINFLGYMIDHEPTSALVVLPTLDEAKKYVRVKLQPTIESTNALKHKVRETKSRDEDGSTTAFKKFRGGFLQITGANSSAGLQMISVRVLIADEISEWPEDVGERGDPLALAEKRTTAWSRNCKRYYVSTPGIKGACRVDAKYDASDMRRRYLPCPQCGMYQVLKPENLKWRSETLPHGAHFVCSANGCIIEHFEKNRMRAAGVWLKTYPDPEDPQAAPGPVVSPEDIPRYRARSSNGRQPGFALWQAYSQFVDWEDTAHTIIEAKGNLFLEKVVQQQVLGETYEALGDAPEYEKLLLRREPYRLGTMPPGVLWLTGMADVQGDRIEWGVYGWGIGMSYWLIDKGVIYGDPSLVNGPIWRALTEVEQRKYEDWQGNLWPVEKFGCDSGYQSTAVYNWCHGQRGRLFALNGSPDPNAAAITAKVIQFKKQNGHRGHIDLFHSGASSLKSTIYGSLRLTIQGPNDDGVWPQGCGRFPDACDEEFFKQLTAEHRVEQMLNGRIVQRWKKATGRANEQLDILVGAMALACHPLLGFNRGLDYFTRAQWQQLASDRGAPPVQAQKDLAELWARTPEAVRQKRADPGEYGRRLARLLGGNEGAGHA